MKTVTVLGLLFILICFSAGAASAAEGAWVLVDEDPMLSNYYYDETSVAEVDGDLVAVRTKAVYTEDGRDDALDTIGHPRGFEDLSSTAFLYIIDCPGNMSRLEKITHYDSKGRAIKSYDLSGRTDWEPIDSETRMSLLHDAVCD